MDQSLPRLCQSDFRDDQENAEVLANVHQITQIPSPLPNDPDNEIAFYQQHGFYFPCRCSLRHSSAHCRRTSKGQALTNSWIFRRTSFWLKSHSSGSIINSRLCSSVNFRRLRRWRPFEVFLFAIPLSPLAIQFSACRSRRHLTHYHASLCSPEPSETLQVFVGTVTNRDRRPIYPARRHIATHDPQREGDEP